MDQAVAPCSPAGTSRAGAPPPGAVVLANPTAAGVTPEVVTHVVERLRAAGRSVHTAWTTGPGHAQALAAAAPAAADGDTWLVALGGDGTVREVAHGLVRRGTPGPALLALPAGSGNSSCRNLWGECDLDAVLDLALDRGACRVRSLDALHLLEPGVVALLGASSGFLADVLVHARRAGPSLSGIDRYFAGAVEVLADMPSHPTRVRVDGRVVHDGAACSVTVGGGRFRAQSFQFLPLSELDDGLLDVCVLAALDGPALTAVSELLPRGDHLARPEVHYGRGRRVVVERTDGAPLLAEFDGEVWDCAGPRLQVDVLPGAVRALAPLVPPHG